jgi:hypothetical protein
MRRTLAALSMVALLALGCGGSGGGGATSAPRPSPTSDLADILASLDHARIKQLTDSSSTSPLFDWTAFKTNTLTTPQKSELCRALDTEGADDVFAAIGAIALDAISLELRRKPVPDDFEGALKIAVGVAFKSCPAWQPLILPTKPTSWYPAGYRLVIGNPGVAWRWTTSPLCQAPSGGACTWMNVIAQNGCPTALTGTVIFRGPDGTALERQRASAIAPVAAGQPVPLSFVTAQRAPTATAEYIDCT